MGIITGQQATLKEDSLRIKAARFSQQAIENH